MSSSTEPLSVFFYPQKRSVDLGATASFNCSIGGYPIDDVRWYKDGTPLYDSEDRVTVHENGTVIIVAGMRREDRGMYQCVAGNAWDTQEATMQLSLGGKYFNVFLFSRTLFYYIYYYLYLLFFI